MAGGEGEKVYRKRETKYIVKERIQEEGFNLTSSCDKESLSRPVSSLNVTSLC